MVLPAPQICSGPGEPSQPSPTLYHGIQGPQHPSDIQGTSPSEMQCCLHCYDLCCALLEKFSPFSESNSLFKPQCKRHPFSQASLSPCGNHLLLLPFCILQVIGDPPPGQTLFAHISSLPDAKPAEGPVFLLRSSPSH